MEGPEFVGGVGAARPPHPQRAAPVAAHVAPVDAGRRRRRWPAAHFYGSALSAGAAVTAPAAAPSAYSAASSLCAPAPPHRHDLEAEVHAHAAGQRRASASGGGPQCRRYYGQGEDGRGRPHA